MNNPSPNTDLELCSTEEIFSELVRRFDHAVFVGMQIEVENQDGTGDYSVTMRLTGNMITCIGLCMEGANCISHARRKESKRKW